MLRADSSCRLEAGFSRPAARRGDRFAVGLRSLHSQTTGDRRVCIAVLDGPVDLAHPCFRGASLAQLDSLALPCGTSGAASAHGTHVASVIFGQPGSPVAGIASGCSGLSIPIFADGPDGTFSNSSQLDLARAILLAVERGADIINISGGQLSPSGEPDPLLARAIDTCAQANVLIVAAAGNDGCDCLHVPAAAASVLSVGAMDGDGHPLTSNNWGEAYRSQGLLAPGMDVLGAVPGGGTAYKSGTSFATPLVSAVAGLLASLRLKRGEPPDMHAIRAVLLGTAVPCVADDARDCRRFFGGSLDLERVLQELARGDKSVISSTTVAPSDGFAPPPVASRLLPSGEPQIIQALHATAPVPEVALSEAEPQSAAGTLGQIAPSDCGCGGGAKAHADAKPCGGGGDCGCGCGGAKAQRPVLVYALGTLGYDFGSEARRDSFAQAMPAGANNPHAADQLLRHLEANPYDASSVIWTLNLDATPIYAIQPVGPYAEIGYERLREFLQGQLDRETPVELVSVPGVIGGKVRLQSGQIVPVIVPALRGLFSWATRPLVEHVLGARPDAAAEAADYDAQFIGLTDFLSRVYYDLRNLGITAEERALNYAATNAVQVREIIASTTRQELDLDRISVKKSPVCRPDSDCFDVELGFFNPNNTNVASRIFRFTVDVSDVIPVTIGAPRNWTRRV
jgi:cyanobactin maturation PatA/PatG family protease